MGCGLLGSHCALKSCPSILQFLLGRYMLTSHGPAGDEKKTVHVMSEVGVTKSLSQFSDESNNGVTLVDAGRLIFIEY